MIELTDAERAQVVVAIDHALSCIDDDLGRLRLSRERDYLTADVDWDAWERCRIEGREVYESARRKIAKQDALSPQ